mmetsp:Transcript_14244/g.10303  ORF Transcript_14244/g.10303 Transcript_14244/m.10303 type:complete len:95 (-) Transcript_14244:255-539(-)
MLMRKTPEDKMMESSNASLENDFQKDLGGLKGFSKKQLPLPGRNSIGPQFREKPLHPSSKIASHTEKKTLLISREHVEFKVIKQNDLRRKFEQI